MQWNDDYRWLQISRVPDIWSWSSRSPKFFDLRMLAIRLTDASIAVVSPVAEVDEAGLAALDSFGPVSAIIAPNYYHNLGIKPLLKRYPKTKLYAHLQAIPRLTKVTGLNFDDIVRLGPLMPPNLEVVCPEGLKQGELWFYTPKRGDEPSLLAVCDCFFNMNHPKKFLLDKFFRLAGTYPGLKVSKVFASMSISNRSQYNAWLVRFFAEHPATVLVPAHGEIYESSKLGSELMSLMG